MKDINFSYPDSDKSREIKLFLEECPECKRVVIIYWAIKDNFVDYDYYHQMLCPHCGWEGFRGLKIDSAPKD